MFNCKDVFISWKFYSNRIIETFYKKYIKVKITYIIIKYNICTIEVKVKVKYNII